MMLDGLLGEPLRWKRPRTVFVNSMSDLFHDGVDDAFIGEVFDVMRRAHWHQFQVLTKRPERALALANRLEWSPNVWLGTSVESATYLRRVDTLRLVPSAVRFLSLEPLLGPLPNLKLRGIDWVIVGGESGIGARPMEADWVREIQTNCRAAGVPFFFKQWGGVRKKDTGRRLDGRTWDEFPRPRV
jgi:protein gp37